MCVLYSLIREFFRMRCHGEIRTMCSLLAGRGIGAPVGKTLNPKPLNPKPQTLYISRPRSFAWDDCANCPKSFSNGSQVSSKEEPPIVSLFALPTLILRTLPLKSGTFPPKDRVGIHANTLTRCYWKEGSPFH